MEEVRGSSPLVRTKTEDKGASCALSYCFGLRSFTFCEIKKRLTDRRFKIFMIHDKFS